MGCLRELAKVIFVSLFSFMKPGGAWFSLDNISGTIPPKKSYTLSISFNPTKTGTFSYKIPLFLKENKNVPYR